MSEPSTPLTNYFNATLSDRYGTLQRGDRSSEQDDDPVYPDADADALDFRLFTRSAHYTSSQVVLRSPTPQLGDPGFVTERPRNYYFANQLDHEKAKEYEQAAISGEAVIAGLQIRYTGCALPWRMTVVQSSKRPSSNASLLSGTLSDGKKRTRKGKKTRLAIRRRLAKDGEQKVNYGSMKLSKEQAKEEKRNRKNREKKIKRRRKRREGKDMHSSEIA